MWGGGREETGGEEKALGSGRKGLAGKDVRGGVGRRAAREEPPRPAGTIAGAAPGPSVRGRSRSVCAVLVCGICVRGRSWTVCAGPPPECVCSVCVGDLCAGPLPDGVCGICVRGRARGPSAGPAGEGRMEGALPIAGRVAHGNVFPQRDLPPLLGCGRPRTRCRGAPPNPVPWAPKPGVSHQAVRSARSALCDARH